jgi:hypothetical protein
LIILCAPLAVRGIQSAERDVLRAAYSAEVADRRRAISGQFAALLTAAEQQIISHVQGKIVLIDPALSPAARRAAIEQLIAEQSAAIIQLKHDIKQQRRQARRSAGVSPRARFKKHRSATVARHASEREAGRDLFGGHFQLRQRAHRAFPAIRRILPFLNRRSALRPRPVHPRQ